MQYNLLKLRQGNSPVEQIKAVYSGPAADKASADDAGGLPTCGLLVNGAIGTVHAICYQNARPPALPTAVMVLVHSYSGLTLPDGTVLIAPIRRFWSSTSGMCSSLRLPLKLSWAITTHKAQGLTPEKVAIEIGEKEFCTGLTFVACSRVCRHTDIVFKTPFTFQCLSDLSKSVYFHKRCLEDARLLELNHSQ